MARYDWTRREFSKAAGICLGAGLLQPVLPLIAAGKTIEKAYPEELLSIEKYTKGRVTPGMIVSKENADVVEDIAPEGLMVELQHGARIKIAKTNLDPTAAVPIYWWEATLRNKGKAKLDAHGQLWNSDGGPWIGGSPFPEPQNALQAVWNYTFNQVRLDDYLILATEVHVDTNGTVVRKYTTTYRQIQTVGRLVVDPKPVIPEYKDNLLRDVLFFRTPFIYRDCRSARRSLTTAQSSRTQTLISQPCGEPAVYRVRSASSPPRLTWLFSLPTSPCSTIRRSPGAGPMWDGGRF